MATPSINTSIRLTVAQDDQFRKLARQMGISFNKLMLWSLEHYADCAHRSAGTDGTKIVSPVPQRK